MDQTKQLSNFERCLTNAKQRADKVCAALDKITIHLRRKDIECAYTAGFEAAYQSEKLTSICRELPAYTGHPTARVMIEQSLLNNFPVELGFTHEGWFCMRIPILLPKKGKGSAEYISAPLYPAMKRFWHGKPPIRYPHNVLIFRHVYSRERPERQYRDHDNIELNKVLDVVALYVMTDDLPMRCRHYYCSALGCFERTEVYVVPRNEFGLWLNQEDSIPDEGVKLFENYPEITKKHM
jgi:hypothetical protein